VPKFYQWLRTEFKGKVTNKPLADSSSLCTTTSVRSFFTFHRYSLEIQKDALPSSEKIENKYLDHSFDIYQLRAMFQCGDLRERTVLACGKDLLLRSGDLGLRRELGIDSI